MKNNKAKAEDELPVCLRVAMTRKSSLWIVVEVMYAQEQEVDECDQECREMVEEPEPTVKTFSEALNALDNVKLFLENHGFHQEAGTISSVGDAM